MTKRIDLVELTRQITHGFFMGEIGHTELFDDELMWIGPLDRHWDAAIPSAKNISKSNRPKIKDELYFMIEKGHDYQVICGAFKALYPRDEPTWKHFRLTFVWKRLGKQQWKISHAHVSQAYDVPLRNVQPQKSPFEVPRKWDSHKTKLEFRDNKGRIHYLSADEIIYIKANNLTCIVMLEKDHFLIRETISGLEQKLPHKFLRSHRSYLINRDHVRVLERFRVQMRNGDWLPIPERKYTLIKEALERKGKDT